MQPLNFSAIVEDENYLAHLGQGVWLMDDHRWALKVWETERKSHQYSLVHADYHWDGCYDFNDNQREEEKLITASSAEIAKLVAENEWIRFDSFIAPAIRRGLIHTVHFYCLQEGIGGNALDADFLVRCNARQFIYSNAQSLANSMVESPFIFDLCLDLFNRSDQWNEGELWSDYEIVKFLTTIVSLVRNAELVTISMSFNYSGTAADTRHLAALVVPIILEYRK